MRATEYDTLRHSFFDLSERVDRIRRHRLLWGTSRKTLKKVKEIHRLQTEVRGSVRKIQARMVDELELIRWRKKCS